MKNNVDLVERGRDRVSIAHVTFDKFRGRIDPRWFAALMRVRLDIIEHTNFPSLAQE